MITEMSRTAVRHYWIVVGALLAGFLLCAIGMLRDATYPGWQDTEAYLGHSLYIADHGGIWGFFRACFDGTFPITERHPLYMLLLAPFASQEPVFFLTAKIIDLLFGLVTLLAFFWMVLRRYGRGPAMIAGVLYGLSSSLLVASSQVNHETQFVLCTLGVWWLLTEPARTASPVTAAPAGGQVSDGRWGFLLRRQSASDAPIEHVPWQRWAFAGVWLGLAYLVKSPALLLAVAIVVAGLWHVRLRFFATRRFWVLLVTTIVVASPLLIRNVRGYGELLYEGVNTNIMWLDQWSELGAEHSIMYYDRYGIVAIERNGLPTAKEYFQTHTAGDIAERLFSGIFKELFVVGPKALSPVLPLPYRVSTSWWGLAVIAFGLAGLWLRRRSWEASLVFFWSAAFVVFFGWNRLFPDMRYLACLIPVWIAYASFAIWTLMIRFLKPVVAWRFVAVGTVVLVLAAVGWTVRSGSLTQPRPIMAQSPSYSHLIDWFNNHIEAGDRVLLGPTAEFYGLLWMVKRPISVIMTPQVDSLDGFLRYLQERKVRYIVMNTENAKGDKGKLTNALAPYLEVTPSGELVEKQRLPGWRPVFADPDSKRHFIVYEAESLRAG